MQTERQHARLKTYIGGRIEQPSPLGTMNCIVRDVSPGGARVAFHNTAAVVERFTLVMPSKGRRFAARVIWRSFGEAGLAFETVSGDASRPYDLPSVDAVERLRSGEARRRLMQIKLDRLNEMA